MTTDENSKPDLTSYMTDRMVLDRCMRMYRNNQWRRLHDFCLKEPRAQAWTVQRIARTHNVNGGDLRVDELFARLARDRPRPVRAQSGRHYPQQLSALSGGSPARMRANHGISIVARASRPRPE